jgi:hypothetical protein
MLRLDFEEGRLLDLATLGISFAIVALGSGAGSADGAELLEEGCGCGHGGVGPFGVEVSVEGCCIASETLTWPFLVLFLPAMTCPWWG